MGDGVPVTEIFEQRRQSREAMPDRGAPELAPREVVAPGDDMRPGDRAEFFRPGDAGELHEVADRVLIGAPGATIADVGKPFDLGRDLGEAFERERRVGRAESSCSAKSSSARAVLSSRAFSRRSA
jgi:hypothetical protein